MRVFLSLLLVLYFSVVYTFTAMGGCLEGDCTNGEGTYAYPDGSTYEGEWKGGLRNGRGAYTRPDGSTYEGEWRNDGFSGQGTYTYADGSTYKGLWKDSMRHGQGTYTRPDGSKYEGQWKSDKLIGEGLFVNSDGKRLAGKFDEEGKFVISMAEVLSREIGKKLEKEKKRKEEEQVSTKKKEEPPVPATAESQKGETPKPASSKKTFVGPNGMEFVHISPCTFMMGSPADEPGRYNNETQHQVTLSKGFYIQTTEVTQGQWRAVMGDNPSYFESCGDNCPVEQVSWKETQQFIQKLNQLEGADKYRLPTEAEWECACRASSTTAFASGRITEFECGHGSNLDAVAWFCGNSGKKTHPVAQKNPNAWGLYDMHGNVSEFCQDWYEPYPADDMTDPTGPASGLDRTVRGGGFNTHARNCRSGCRGALSTEVVEHDTGFRLARTP